MIGNRSVLMLRSEIVVFVDINPDKAERFLEEFNLKAVMVYESCERMLASG